MKSSVTQKVRKADELGQFEESRGNFLFLHKMGDRIFHIEMIESLNSMTEKTK